ncbi:TPA: hypothetical protein RQK56_004054, partial [Vibrio vulnificus]|nr:hypothetical protein [Vibrio vulnificus]
KLVLAADEHEAGENAMLGECHGDIADGTAEWVNDGVSDLGWEFHYSVISSKKIEKEHVTILRKYFSDFV